MTDTNWQTNLKEQGAIFDQNIIQHFGNIQEELLATSSKNILCDLSHLGVFTVSGDDAKTFLQGQVTNDVMALDGHHAHYSGYCSPKGRLLALFLAFYQNHNFYLQCDHSILASTIKRLKMFVLRSKVNITDRSADLIRFGINGPDATAILKKSLITLPNIEYGLVSILEGDIQTGIIIKLPSIKGHERFEILLNVTHAESIWNKLKEDCQLVGKPCWDWLDIQTGLPDVVLNTQEQFVPQMLNLDRLNGINFKKGCYTGQEIVARTHYLGTVKRRTYKVSIPCDMTPHEGEKITDEKDNEVGQIVRVAPNIHNGVDALIEIRIEAKNTGNIYWKSQPVTFGTLPYQLEDSQAN